MRMACKSLGGLLSLASGTSASGGLVVTSYYTQAQTNGYAPTSQTQYYEDQRLDNISPAIADVFGDWTGPNADGTPDTWRFVGHSRAWSRTTITPTRLAVEGSAFFNYQLDTASTFVDPRSSGIFGPNGSAQYRSFFETDVALLYSITAELNQLVSRVRLSSFDGSEIFNERGSNDSTRVISFSGMLQPGQYQFLAGTGTVSPNLPDGINQYGRSGSVENLVFSVSVPEPSIALFGYAGCGLLLSTRLVARAVGYRK